MVGAFCHLQIFQLPTKVLCGVLFCLQLKLAVFPWHSFLGGSARPRPLLLSVFWFSGYRKPHLPNLLPVSQEWLLPRTHFAPLVTRTANLLVGWSGVFYHWSNLIVSIVFFPFTFNWTTLWSNILLSLDFLLVLYAKNIS